MAKRRNNHEGTICRLPSGRWRAQIVINGQRRGFTADTRQACSIWLRNIHHQLPQNPILAGESKSLGVFLKDWLAIAKSSLRLTTWTQYHHLVENHILPVLGAIPF